MLPSASWSPPGARRGISISIASFLRGHDPADLGGRLGLPHLDLVAVGEDAVAADQLDPHLAERLVVEGDGCAAAAAEQRAAAAEDQVEPCAERGEVEPLVL